MSFLKEIKKIEPKTTEITPKVKSFKQKNNRLNRKTETFKQKDFEINPNVKSIDDIPTTNIMTSGNLLGIVLRATRPKMLKNLRNHINNLLSGEKNAKN